MPQNTASRAFVEGKFRTGFRAHKELGKVTFNRHLPLDERLLRIDHIQARRFSKLGGTALDIATEGIMRHLRASEARMHVREEVPFYTGRRKDIAELVASLA